MSRDSSACVSSGFRPWQGRRHSPSATSSSRISLIGAHLRFFLGCRSLALHAGRSGPSPTSFGGAFVRCAGTTATRDCRHDPPPPPEPPPPAATSACHAASRRHRRRRMPCERDGRSDGQEDHAGHQGHMAPRPMFSRHFSPLRISVHRSYAVSWRHYSSARLKVRLLPSKQVQMLQDSSDQAYGHETQEDFKSVLQ